MGPEKAIYCFVGDPEIPSEFMFIRLPPRQFFALPSFNGVPELLEFGYYHAAIGWRQWDSSSDTGEGPIVGYKIYVRSGSNVVLAKEVQPPSMVNNTGRSVSKRSAENASEMVMYNVSGLEAGSTYSVQIAAIRDGTNGEGEQGPALTFKTENGPTPSSSPTTSSPSTSSRPISSPAGDSSSSISTVVGSAVGAIFVIVIAIILIIIIFYKRRSNESATTKSKGKDSDSSPQYENPVFDQSKGDAHTYQNLHTDTNTNQDPNTDTQSYENLTDSYTYQDLKKPDQEANYEALTDAIQGDYVNVEDV
ncbi:uncharacterized protein LOC105444245 [Strongylocentrotus purpuratus]|uniref:Fibronectin type-III domain-containing protein n=1 Tax=Strongylocentrotus purpuratus TaxID=7668 RepID=A0A7M7T1L5_STRPU|nr:uncharacterized protein LOC105444245 [Strongylocentrotus purpuratus]